MVNPLIPQGSKDQSLNHAKLLVSSGHTYRPSLLSSKGLSLPVSHDENAHHVVPRDPYLVPLTSSKDKLSPSTEKLNNYDPVHPGITESHLLEDNPPLAKATCPLAKDICRACAVPNRYMVHHHELLPKFLSQIDMSSHIFGEYNLLPEIVSDGSEYLFHEAKVPTDSGYHSPQPMVPACLDASSNPVSMVPVSTNNVPCPFPKDGTLMHFPGKEDEILSPVLCNDTGCPDVKFPAQMLPLASTSRATGENLTNAGSTCAPLGKSETFRRPNYPIPCNCIMGPIEQRYCLLLLSFLPKAWLQVTPVGLMDI